MKIKGYKINNYKSIGLEDNYISIESKVTALIGKNESGKSNVLEAIGKLPLLVPMNKNYSNNINRGLTGEISVTIDLEFYQEELIEFDINQSITVMKYLDNTTVKIEGGLSNLIENDRLLINSINELIELRSDRSAWGNDGTTIKSVQGYLDELKRISSQIFLNYITKSENLERYILRDYEDRERLINCIKTIQDRLSIYYNLIPQIYYRSKDQQLDSTYKYEDIKNILKDINHIFYRFLIAAEINEEEIQKAFESTIDGEKQTIRNQIYKKIERNIEEKFNVFYTQEKITVQVVIESNLFKIYISTDDKVMNLSERSNGLRWYFSLFVDVLSRDYMDRSVIFLLDEPGVYLHVNAQKELLKLFSKLTEGGNQLVYTTHSPYMIDSQDILNVRAIEKDQNGNTKIFKNAYNQKLSNKSKMETLSPLLEAIGVDLKFNIGPSNKNNIITEGISEYMYMKAMLYNLEVDNPTNIIPSTGARNINKIASILIGWGCDFKILLDYDTEGYREYKFLVNKLDETLKDKIYFVNLNVEPDETEIKLSPKTIESLICERDFQKLCTPYDGTSSTKILAAKEFHDKVLSEEITPEQDTISNFNKLFLLLLTDL